MKKVFNKIRGKKPQESQAPARITNDTLAEHREKVLAGGRRFKYPVQYQRHKLVFNAIIIAIVAVLLAFAMFAALLYSAQNTSEFMYRVTRVIPVPVASIDGQPVRYSDYLMKYRSAMHYYVEKERLNLETDSGQRQSDIVKNDEMNDAITDAYAQKLARENDVTVTDAELEEYLIRQREQVEEGVSESTYEAVILDYYGWSPQEYREAMRNKLLRQKVMYAVDDPARQHSDTVAAEIKDGATNLENLAKEINSDGDVVGYGKPGWLPLGNQDGGVTAAAAELDEGEISGPIQSYSNEGFGLGYYYIRVLDREDDRVSYEYIHVPLTVFVDDIADALDPESDRVTIFITLPDITTIDQTQS